VLEEDVMTHWKNNLGVLVVLLSVYVFVALPAFAECGPNVTRAGDTWYVSPTGTDDTANIQCALDEATAAGPGSAVQLMAGTFHTSIIEVVGFDGFLKGVGKDATVITSLPNLPCAAEIPKNSFPSLFKFREGNIRISDLSFNITEFEPCDLWVIPTQGLLRHDLGAIVNVTGPPRDESDCPIPSAGFASSSIERVGFTGSTGTLFGRDNVDNGLAIFPDGIAIACLTSPALLVGTHTVSNSSFTNLFSGAGGQLLANGSFTVGGSPNKRNTFDGVRFSIGAADISDSVVEISFNDIKNTINFGVYIVQGERILPSPSEFLISHNTIHAILFADGVSLEDYGPLFGGGKTLEAVISNNKIFLDDTLYGGILGLFGAQDVVVTNNKITGNGLAGIYMGVFYSFDEVGGWMLQGNNVDNVSAFVAPIWLGFTSSNSTVVGSDAETNVLDEGTNNILVGVNNMGAGKELGQDLKDAMEQKREIMKSMRGW
jgi:hypothetical protein